MQWEVRHLNLFRGIASLGLSSMYCNAVKIKLLSRVCRHHSSLGQRVWNRSGRRCWCASGPEAYPDMLGTRFNVWIPFFAAGAQNSARCNKYCLKHIFVPGAASAKFDMLIFRGLSAHFVKWITFFDVPTLKVLKTFACDKCHFFVTSALL